jgi:hypothetical protein
MAQWWQEAYVLAYVLAISFQLAGALLLIVRYWFKSVESQLAVVESKRTHMIGEMLYLGKTQPDDSELVEEIWINRLAFVYIALGYFLGIWGDPLDTCKCKVALLAIFIASILVTIGKIASAKASNKYKNSQKNT